MLLSGLNPVTCFRNPLPVGAQSQGFGIGRSQFPVQSAVLGGHVRVCMEDNILIFEDQSAKSNAT